MRRWAAMTAIGGAGLLAACTPPARVAPAVAPPVALPAQGGLARVMGQDAAALVRLFGPADADVREGPGRKLQFAGRFCVLDAYLYPPTGAAGEPRVTWIDTREPDGSTIDRASCIAALTRRDGGK